MKRTLQKCAQALGGPGGWCSFQGCDFGADEVRGQSSCGKLGPEVRNKSCDPPRRELTTPALWPHSPPSRPHPPELPVANIRAPSSPLVCSTEFCLWGHWAGWGQGSKWIWWGRGRHPAQKPTKTVSPGRTPSYCICFSHFICGVFVCIYTDPWKSHFFITKNLT